MRRVWIILGITVAASVAALEVEMNRQAKANPQSEVNWGTAFHSLKDRATSAILGSQKPKVRQANLPQIRQPRSIEQEINAASGAAAAVSREQLNKFLEVEEVRNTLRQQDQERERKVFWSRIRRPVSGSDERAETGGDASGSLAPSATINTAPTAMEAKIAKQLAPEIRPSRKVIRVDSQ